MGCRVEFALRDGMLRAVVSGKSSCADAAWIARNIVEQAGERIVKRVLIDVRRLAGRVGTLGTLSMANGDPGKVSGYRVAVVDVDENDPYYVFHEIAAGKRGYALRYFGNADAAADWLGRAED